jgi:hypothetical protein
VPLPVARALFLLHFQRLIKARATKNDLALSFSPHLFFSVHHCQDENGERGNGNDPTRRKRRAALWLYTWRVFQP